MPRDNFTMSENSGSFGMQQRQDRFDAIGDLIVGPPGPPGPQGPPGADGTVSFDELTPAQKESLRGEGVPAGGTTGQVLAKASNTDYDTEWVDQSGGGGGTSDYTDLTNKPSINNVTLSGNKTTAELGLTSPVQSVNNKTGAVVLSASDVSALPLAGGTMAGNIDMNGNKVTKLPTPTNYQDAANKDYVDKRYLKPSTGIPQADLASAVQNKLDKTVVISDTQPTAAENKLWVDTDAGTGSTYQVPTVAEMEAADAQIVNYTEYTLTKLSTATNWTIIRYHACKLGKIAFLQIVASVTAAQDSSGVRIFALPQDLRPRYGVETRFTSAEFAMDVNVNITVEGNVAFTRGGSTAGNIRMDFCYPTN